MNRQRLASGLLKTAAALAGAIVCTALAAGCSPTKTQVDRPDSALFQYSTEYEYSRRDSTRTGRAHLWLPTQRRHVRGVIVAGLTSMERRFVKNGTIRQTCDEEGLALLFVNTGLRSADVPALLKRFAEKSGYAELAHSPLMFVGHSAGGPQARDLAKQFAQRCFGLVQHRGGLADGVPAEVPSLAMVGQFDEFGGLMRDEKGYEGAWERAVEHTARMRTEKTGKLASITVDAGAGHFVFSDREAEYLALFIRKAADARIPKDWPRLAQPPGKSEPVACVDIDPATGWLTDLRLDDPRWPAAPVGEYGGKPGEAGWHFDEQMARRAMDFHAGQFGRRDQFVTWKDPHWVDGGARIYFLEPAWVDDGQTFRVHPVYRETYPSQHKGQGPRWLKAGQPVGHSDEPIGILVANGPLAKVGPRKIRMEFDALNPVGQRMRAFFVAYSPGDETYRYTEHVGMLPRGFTGFDKGTDQHITFPAIADTPADAGPFELYAATSTGLQPEYYVDYGPARVVDGKLVIDELPPRARYPIEVKVTAYQFGRGVAPLVKTAQPVSRTFLITR